MSLLVALERTDSHAARQAGRLAVRLEIEPRGALSEDERATFTGSTRTQFNRSPMTSRPAWKLSSCWTAFPLGGVLSAYADPIERAAQLSNCSPNKRRLASKVTHTLTLQVGLISISTVISRAGSITSRFLGSCWCRLVANWSGWCVYLASRTLATTKHPRRLICTKQSIL